MSGQPDANAICWANTRTYLIDEAKLANDPISQFQISKILPLEALGTDISFTNSSLFMVATVGVSAAFLIMTTSGRGLIPSRLQSISEICYEFVADLLRSSAGSEGMRFFPLVFSLFVFILVANLFGMFPYFFTVTSHIIVTAALALLVIGLVIVYGFWKNGLGFLKLFDNHRLDLFFSEDIKVESAPDITFGLRLAREF